jgi:hypothetical protein
VIDREVIERHELGRDRFLLAVASQRSFNVFGAKAGAKA